MEFLFSSYMDFIENSYRLNELAQYPRLTERAKKIGFEITKVVFRGYFASTKLQAMHDTSIKARTKLKLDVTCLPYFKLQVFFFYFDSFLFTSSSPNYSFNKQKTII